MVADVLILKEKNNVESFVCLQFPSMNFGHQGLLPGGSEARGLLGSRLLGAAGCVL